MESFNGKLRDELLNGELFDTLTEAKVLIENWRIKHNTVRAHWRANNVSESGEAHCQACLPRIPANRNMVAMIKITEPVLTISRGGSPGVFLET